MLHKVTKIIKKMNKKLTITIYTFCDYMILSVVLVRPTWTNEKFLQVYQRLTHTEVIHFADDVLLRNLNVECLVLGSTNKSMVGFEMILFIFYTIYNGELLLL